MQKPGNGSRWRELMPRPLNALVKPLTAFRELSADEKKPAEAIKSGLGVPMRSGKNMKIKMHLKP